MAAVASDTTEDQGTRGGHSTLVVNVWYEAHHPEPFRARLTSMSGDAFEVTTKYAATREAVLSGVGEWLDGLFET